MEEPKKETNNDEGQEVPATGFENKEPVPRISPLLAAFIGLAGGFILYQIVGGFLALLVFNFDVKNASVNALRLMTMAGQILFLLLPALIFTKYIYRDVTKILRVKIPSLAELVLFTCGIVLLTLLLQNYLYIQNYYITEFAKYNGTVKSIKSFIDSMNDYVEKSYGDLLAVHNPFDAFLVVFVVSVIPALCEETLFRGFIQRSLEYKLSPMVSSLITAIFFGLYHFNIYGLVALIGLGFFFGYANYKSGSIFVPMFLHFLNNFSAVAIYLTVGNEDLINSAATSNIDIRMSLIGMVVLVVLFVAYMVFINNYYKSQKQLRR